MTTLIQINPAGGAAPTATDDSSIGYSVGSFWIYGGDGYFCTDATEDAAVWVRLANVSAALTALLAAFTPASASTAAGLAFAEDTDNGAHEVNLKAPASVAADVDVVLPGVAGTLALLAEVEPVAAFSIISDASVDLDLTHDRTTLILTNATPALTVQAQSAETYPDGFRCDVVFVNDGTLVGGTGVDINDATAETFDVSARPNTISLTRIGSDDWIACGGLEVAP